MRASTFPPPPESLRRDPAVLQWLIQLVNRTLRNALIATQTEAGRMFQGAAVADAPASSVSVTAAAAPVSSVAVSAPAAPVQGPIYVQSDINALVTLANEIKQDMNQLVAEANGTAALANELKSDLNQLVQDVNAIRGQLNALLASQRAAGQIVP